MTWQQFLYGGDLMVAFKWVVVSAFLWLIFNDLQKQIKNPQGGFSVTVKGAIVFGTIAGVLGTLLHNYMLGTLCSFVLWMILREIYERLEN